MTNQKAPLFHISKRRSLPWYLSWCVRLCAILLALVVCALVTTALTGENPIAVYKTMWTGAFGTPRKTWILAQNVAILLCVSLAVTPAFRMRFWNIGGEGQVLVGGLASAACMILLGDKIPNALLIALMVVCSLAAGGLWAGIPAFFKAKWNTNETLFTLMMNYVAIQVTSYCVAMWENPFGSNSVGIINPKTQAGWFTALFGQKYGWNILIAVVICVLVFVYLKYTKPGYEISVVGGSENTARYAGIDVKKVTMRTLALSGAICGLAGFLIVAGKDQTIATTSAGGRGFTAIIVAWLAKFNTFYMTLISFLLVFLSRGAGEIASSYGLNDFASDVISGVILFCILGSEFFIQYRLVFRGHSAIDKKEVVD